MSQDESKCPEDMADLILALSGPIQALQQLARRAAQQVEHTLDRLLDFAFDDKVLVQFKRLLRYCYNPNPEAAVGYVNAYREMWDGEGDQP